MRMLSLDYEPVYGAANTSSRFAADTSVFDYDVVVWDAKSSFESYTTYSQDYLGLPALSDAKSAHIKADALRRSKEFAEFLALSRTIVLVGSEPLRCHVATGKVEYSGTGRNARSTRLVAPFELLSAVFPPDWIVPTKASGDRIEAVTMHPLAQLLRKYRNELHYEATLEGAGTPIARIEGTPKTVALVLERPNGGRFVVLPSTLFLVDDDDDGLGEDYDDDDGQATSGMQTPATPTISDGSKFQDDLLQALEESSESAQSSRPSWAENFSTSKAQRSIDAVAAARAAIEQARAEFSQAKAALEAAQVEDQLFLGSGRQLELRVRDAFLALGFEVTEPAAGRTDWKLSTGDLRAVVEVKGLSKSAAEKNAAQLEKWVSVELEESEVAPKAILVANTWRATPLTERTEPDFPAQMLPYCKARGHCLLTGLQLFTILQIVATDQSKTAFWREHIMSSAGPLEGVPDWRIYIEERTTRESI